MAQIEERLAESARNILARCDRIAKCTETAGGITRTFLCEPMHDCHRLMSDWMTGLGMKVTVDAIGNLRGVYPAISEHAPRLLIGSHLDTVRNAGAFDGVLGVVLALQLVELLDSERLPFEIEAIGFSEEEGVRFGVPFLGSRALVGRVDDALLETRDRSGTSVRDAIRHFGLDPSQIGDARLDDRSAKGADARRETAKKLATPLGGALDAATVLPELVNSFAFVEFHIEQGPVLDTLDQPLGIVEAIAGQTRCSLTFNGQANHAGATPMRLRRDAMAGAAEWIAAVEAEANSVPGLVATVGALEIRPGVSNVIAGSAAASLDIRHASDEARTQAFERLLKMAELIAKRRGLSVDHQVLLDQPAVKMDPAMVQAAVAAAGCNAPIMISGAGHDAMIMAEKLPSVMFFIRSPGGISHHPDESVNARDLEAALATGIHFLKNLAAQSR